MSPSNTLVPFPSVSGRPRLFAWKWQLIALCVTFAIVVLPMWGKHAMGFNRSLFFWPPGGVVLALLLLRGRRLLPGVLVGWFLGYMCWFSPSHSLMLALIGAGQAALGCTLIHYAWPHGLRYIPSTRFFAIMIVAGALIPSALASWPGLYLMDSYIYPEIEFREGFLGWWLGGCISVIVFTPALLLFRPSFRDNGWRSMRAMFWALAQIALCVYVAWWLLKDGGPRPIIAITVIIALGCLVAFRCGVTGVIVVNVALVLVEVVAQIGISVKGGLQIAQGMRTEFDMIILETTGICLLVAGGLYDYRRASRELHGVSSRVLKAQEIERRRISSDLHDGVCQTLFGAIMQLRLAASGQQPDKDAATLKAEMETIADDLANGLKDLRRTIAGLRPEMLDQSSFSNVLADYCAEVEARSNVDVLFSDETIGEAENLSLDLREHLFRLTQEAVSNSLQHGKASIIQVVLSSNLQRSGWLSLRIIDNGIGFDLAPNETATRLHLGLRTMEERALLIGGSLRIESSPEQGTLVSLTFPVAPACVSPIA